MHYLLLFLSFITDETLNALQEYTNIFRYFPSLALLSAIDSLMAKRLTKP